MSGTAQGKGVGVLHGRWSNYYSYQKGLAGAVVIPQLGELGLLKPGQRVLEAGCAAGGIISAISVLDPSSRCVGLDISKDYIEQALASAPARSNLRFILGDLLAGDAEAAGEGPFDLILCRDLLEHVSDLPGALKVLAGLLAPDGKVFVTFPPYYSPFGGHQHFSTNGLKYIPYVHYLPWRWFGNLLPPRARENSAEVRRARLTVRKFEHAIARLGLPVHFRCLYLTRPVFRYRYGLPTIRAGILGSIPLVREVVTTGAVYVLGSAAGP